MMAWITTVTGALIVKIRQEIATTNLIANVMQRVKDVFIIVIAARTGVTGGLASNYLLGAPSKTYTQHQDSYGVTYM